jgi:hypothetical protein
LLAVVADGFSTAHTHPQLQIAEDVEVSQTEVFALETEAHEELMHNSHCLLIKNTAQESPCLAAALAALQWSASNRRVRVKYTS